MSFFKTDTKDVKTGGGLLPEGRYEVEIVNAEASVNNQGSNVVTVDYEVRSDVEGQKYGGYKVLYNKLTFSDNEYAIKRINQFLYACGFENGKEFESPEHLIKEIKGKALIITTKNEPSYNNPDRVYPQAKFFSRTKFPKTNDEFAIGISDEDLPF